MAEHENKAKNNSKILVRVLRITTIIPESSQFIQSVQPPERWSETKNQYSDSRVAFVKRLWRLKKTGSHQCRKSLSTTGFQVCVCVLQRKWKVTAFTWLKKRHTCKDLMLHTHRHKWSESYYPEMTFFIYINLSKIHSLVPLKSWV